MGQSTHFFRHVSYNLLRASLNSLLPNPLSQMFLEIIQVPLWVFLALPVIAHVARSWISSWRQGSRSKLPLPPGPKPVPLLGNINDLPKPGVIEYTHWLTHREKYGPISCVTILGNTLVLANELDVALDLLEHKGNSSKTSGRPIMPFAQDLVGYENSVVFGGYNDDFRRKRALLHSAIGTAASAEHYRKCQEIESVRQLERILDDPKNVLEHYKRASSVTILKTVYGYSVNPSGPDPVLNSALQAMKEFSEVVKPFSWAVDLFPSLKHIPDWAPGASFKKKARAYRRTLTDMAHIPYRFVQHQLASGVDSGCTMSRLIQNSSEAAAAGGDDDERLIVWAAGSLFGAAVDTASVSLAAFTLAMLKHPEAQRAAQAEIDRVVAVGPLGRRRLPTSADRAALPYVDAVVKETLRWWSVFPMGIPHRADEEVEYRGYRIPEGASVLPAVWWFMHDPAVYRDPDRFDPARFTDPARNEPDPTKSGVYGFGRRACPGRHFANNLLFVNIAQILASFNIVRLTAGEGRESDGVDGLHPTPGPVMYIKDFKFHISPRSPEHEDLIKRMARENPVQPGGDSSIIASMA
ncbi:hypothetical protein GGTG_06694 [Gaeumannomyces tritici R3-111a-1]|uniref:O-methylsterigmatocystin oxidoreductase n=1 Tax=Gaeumannomyces tritici (strain R3-111a-1) TaxID=644352 RepID=J3NZJ6_GAET3|nr:hypothetical protein GGTG_06694 [Gaeumannomyces tritici R3-111a-1]EJT76779.1 hypothetical protein GGTG_06694 [Gaeumannomyces tritici R3-111a-1]